MKITDIHPLINYLARENYNTEEQEEKSNNEIMFLVYLIISVLAFYLSWSCNTIKEEPFVIKLILGIFAAFFNWLYIILYFIFRYPCIGCNPINTQ